MAQTRLALLEKLSQHLEKWDGTSEQAETIIAFNTPVLAELKQFDEQQENETYTKTEQQQVKDIIESQQKLLMVIKTDRKSLLDKMKQVNKKDKVVENYYSSFQQSIFIDKGI